MNSDYGKGECSVSCTTYRDYKQLAANNNFTIRNVEVWGVGEKPVVDVRTKLPLFNRQLDTNIVYSMQESASEQDSILSGNLEEKAILEMAGRQQYSEGLREEKS